jgi:hypothetical protein
MKPKETDRMARFVRPAFVATMSLVVLGLPALAQEADQELRDKIEALERGQAEIKKELAEIKRLLSAQRKAAPAGPEVRDKVFDLGDNPIKGEQTAKLTLVEFTDYQ